MTKILLIDNNDSFTYNLVQLVEQCGAVVTVMNESNYNKIFLQESSAIILSPGPGLPEDFPLMMDVIDKFHDTKPILGVCLGHQALATYFGGELFRVSKVRHGIKSCLINTEGDLYHNLVNSIEVGRYHSWAVKDNLPIKLNVTSRSDIDNIIMSFCHRDFDINGIQYHPESIITKKGAAIMKNWLCTIK